MDTFEGKIAVITGGGTGMGRELAIQLSKEGCHIAMCDLSADNMQETQTLCKAVAPKDTRISTHICDVSNETQVLAFRDAMLEAHETNHINLLFNNAGIGGGGSFVRDEREDWERTFGVCWFGVYFCARAFVPLLVASEEGYIINTSSVNGFWAALGPKIAHTAYSAAKFAVKGFTEALITDLKTNAPHVRAAVVMPGHIGTSIVANSNIARGKNSGLDMTAEEVAETRAEMQRLGMPVSNISDDHIRQAAHKRAMDFKEKAPTTAAQAANIILTGVRENKWRLLIGKDAHRLDERVRSAPEDAYSDEFFASLTKQGVFTGINNQKANED
ncbi:MAG: SDR family oxidoreductase [Pseudomonadales bacterium]|nr:SDR family oxidoreductase [Pseudomonadales bacterium]